MVRNISWLTLISFSIGTCQASLPPNSGGLHLVWQGAKSPGCQRLVEAFLSELRALASDRVIQLEARQPAGGSNRDFAMQCEEHETPPRSLVVRQGAEAVTMHYLAKAGGFDATDWLPFQQKFLRPGTDVAQTPSDPSLAPQPSAKSDGIPLPLAEPGRSATMLGETATPSIFKQWWFWALVGGAGAGAFALTRTGQHDSNSMNVEIR